jgi:hypothetical protein
LSVVVAVVVVVVVVVICVVAVVVVVVSIATGSARGPSCIAESHSLRKRSPSLESE